MKQDTGALWDGRHMTERVRTQLPEADAGGHPGRVGSATPASEVKF